MNTTLQVGPVRGEEHGRSKLTVAAVLEIRKESRRGVGYRRLAEHFSVSPATIACIVKRRTWAHVQEPQQPDAA